MRHELGIICFLASNGELDYNKGVDKEQSKDLVLNLLKPEFIKFLIKKLKTGNLRGSHLNCLPGKARNRFSLFELFKALQCDPVDVIKSLTENDNFNLRINIPPISEEKYEKFLEDPEFIKSKNYAEFAKERVILARRLNNISYDLKNEIQEFGTKSFGFGFPTFAIQDPTRPEKILVAPLLIWYLDLKQDLHQSNNWILSKSEENPIVFNEVLFNYLKESHGVTFEDFKEVQERILEDGIVDAREISELVFLFEKKLNQGKEVEEVNFDEIKPQDFPSKDNLIERLRKDRIIQINNGSFAFYRTYKESIVQDMENMLKNLSGMEAEAIDSYQSDFFSAISTDPSQSKLLESLGSEKNILVQGPPGTGKSQSLTAIITNALRSHAKCLVVCEKKTAMEILHSNLNSLGLGSLAVMIDDPIKDRNKVVEIVRKKIESVEPVYYSSSLEGSLEIETANYNTSRKRLESHHALKNTKQIDDYTRKDLIGKILRSESINDKLLELDSGKFNFGNDEYKNIKSIISQFEVLTSFLVNNDPLLSLTDKFVENDYIKSKKSVYENLNSLAKDLEFILENYKNAVEEYEEELFNRCEQTSAKVINCIDEITSHYRSLPKDVQQTLNYDNANINLSVKLLANLSSRSKNILLFKQNTLKNLKKISNEFSRNKLMTGLNIADLDQLNTKNLLDELRKLKELSGKSYIKKLVKNHLEEFSINSEKYVETDLIKEITINFGDYKKLLEENVINTDLKIEENIKLSEIVQVATERLKLLRGILNRIDYLHEYYTLVKYLNEQEENVRELLQKFLYFPRENWGLIFDEWFVNNYLRTNESPGLLRSDNEIRKIIKTQHSIRTLYPKLIHNYWNSELARAISLYSRNTIALKSLYNLRGANGKRRNSLRTILSYDFDTFTKFFPVVLTNPSTVSSIMPLKLGLFDVVIFDEASQLRIEDTLASFIRGNIHIVSGDKHQMPPSSFFISDVDVVEEDESLSVPEGMQNLQKTLEKNHLYNLVTSESLLDFADQLHFMQAYLDIHYRSQHPDLIEFSNKAFYGSRLVPTPPIKIDTPPIIYHEANGVYQSEDNVNQKECEEVIGIIQKEYESNPDLKIGVATFNLSQRNLILDSLSEKSSKEEKFAKMMNELENNGFFVKNLENIQGDERDIIIISTTFGKREDGTFLQNFGPLTKKGGYRLLNVIITRAKERLHIVTSIPSEYYLKYEDLLTHEGNDGKAIFYAYLVYAKAVSDNDIALKELVLSSISRNVDALNVSREDLELTESPFEEEVYQRMTKYIPKEYIHAQQKVGGFRLDLVVDTNDASKKIAIECDGATYHRSEEDHFWDIFRQEYLENFGYIFHRIWSENWFEDPSSEMRKLMAFIEANGGYVKKASS